MLSNSVFQLIPLTGFKYLKEDHMKSSGFKVFVISLILCTALHFSHGEEAKKNKFREREASDDALGYPNVYDSI